MAISVLLVDDEVSFVEPISKRLGVRGFAVSTANDGAAGLATLAAKEIDVVVLDVSMPGMDGITALSEIKRRHPLVEVIVLTGHASIETSTTGMAGGAFDYLLKPVVFEDLVFKIEDAYQRRHLASGPEDRPGKP
ncbi:MAG: response regulator [Planctomycetota bacterium]|jgi:DNA-binding NtrC family response regulator